MSPFEILQTQMDVINNGIRGTTELEAFNLAMKEHLADERERMADEVIKVRTRGFNIPQGYDDEGNPTFHD